MNGIDSKIIKEFFLNNTLIKGNTKKQVLEKIKKYLKEKYIFIILPHQIISPFSPSISEIKIKNTKVKDLNYISTLYDEFSILNIKNFFIVEIFLKNNVKIVGKMIEIEKEFLFVFATLPFIVSRKDNELGFGGLMRIDKNKSESEKKFIKFLSRYNKKSKYLSQYIDKYPEFFI